MLKMRGINVLTKNINEYYQESLINWNKNFGISHEAEIITNEVLKATSLSTKCISENIIK